MCGDLCYCVRRKNINEEHHVENVCVHINMKRRSEFEETMIQFIWANRYLQTSILGILDQSGEKEENYSLELRPSSSFVAGQPFSECSYS